VWGLFGGEGLGVTLSLCLEAGRRRGGVHRGRCALGFGFRVSGLVFRVSVSGFGGEGLGFTAQTLGTTSDTTGVLCTH